MAVHKEWGIDHLTAYMEEEMQRIRQMKEQENTVSPKIWLGYVEGDAVKKIDALPVGDGYYVVFDIPIGKALTKKLEQFRGFAGDVEPEIFVVLHTGSADIIFGDSQYLPTQVSTPDGLVYRVIAPVQSYGTASAPAECSYNVMLGPHEIAQGFFQMRFS